MLSHAIVGLLQGAGVHGGAGGKGARLRVQAPIAERKARDASAGDP